MTDTAVSSALTYYAAHGCALFPIPAGQKSPVGIVKSFASDCSTDPAVWLRWAQNNPHCNFGIVAGPSRLIIADVDISEIGRERAWALWVEWFTSRGLPVPMPHIQSARGGWHFLFSLPAGFPIETLRQVALIGPSDGSKKAIVDLRVGNGFTVAAGSYYDGTARKEASGPYVFLSDAAPYPCPDALIEHCKRSAPTASHANIGAYDKNDVAGLINWLAERSAFTSYEDWLGVGMAIKLELGDSGLDVWRITHDQTVDPDTEQNKWASFASDPTPGVQTIASWMQRAHKMGWKGKLGKSGAAMFAGVAALAAAAGATLSSGGPAGAMPMMAAQQVLTDLSAPILSDFLTATADAPSQPESLDFPTLPEACSGHGLYLPLLDCVSRIFSMAGTPKTFKGGRVIDPLAVLCLVHQDTFESVCRRIRAMGCTLPDGKIKLAVKSLSDKVERHFVTQDEWLYSVKGEIEADNSDNVAVFLGILSCELRWNAWLERAEIRGGMDPALRWPQWTYIDDAIVAKLRTRGNRTKTRFRPGKDFFWESLLALAQENPVDPAVDRIAEMQTAWDGQPRLSIWLSAACGVPCDIYHQAVSRNIIGGMVRRIRQPGCKHDTIPVFYGPQGTGKSTLAAILATQSEWFSDDVMLGDASKELVLSLAGKSVVEVSEMGMRGSANTAHVKAMLSRQVDRGRTAYARSVSERPRRNVFIGTTNEDEPLQDTTGNRRFLPVCVATEINLAWLSANIAQIVGEAAALESRGDDFAIPRSVWGVAAEHQEAARQASDIETLLDEWFEPGMFSEHAYILASDLVHLSNLAQWRGGGGVRASIMKRLGFKSESVMVTGKRTRIWARGVNNSPAAFVKHAVRYIVGVDQSGRPVVTIRSPGADQGVPV